MPELEGRVGGEDPGNGVYGREVQALDRNAHTRAYRALEGPTLGVPPLVFDSVTSPGQLVVR